MTILYSSRIATNSPLAFHRLVFRWKGSVYRYIWCEFLIFFGLYYVLRITYQYLLSESLRISFESYCIYCNYAGSNIPIAMVLGFFVDLVVSRWWQQFMSLPWPDNLAMLLNAYTTGSSKNSRMQLRTIMRYANLSYCLIFRNISSKVHQRFPSEESLVSEGYMTQDELKQFHETLPSNLIPSYAIPIFWAMQIVNEMHREGSISSDRGAELITVELQAFRAALGTISCYNWINIPLVYTQVASITLYSYFISSLFAWQFLQNHSDLDNQTVDIYFPIFGVLRFVFYMGMLKVAESLINPFGDDPDDFEIDDMISRNFAFSYFLVDEMRNRAPKLSRGILLETEDSTRRQSISDFEKSSRKSQQLFVGSFSNIPSVPNARQRKSIFSSNLKVISEA